MPEVVNGLVLNDLGPTFQQAAKIPEQYQQAQINQQALQSSLIQNQKGQIGLDEMKITQPERMYDAYTNSIKNSNVVSPEAMNLGMDPNQGVDGGKVSEAIISKYGSMEKAQEEFKKMPPEKRQKTIQDIMQQAAVDHEAHGFGMKDLQPVGTTQAIVNKTPDGKIVLTHAGPEQKNVDFMDPEAVHQQLMGMGQPVSQGEISLREANLKAQTGLARTQMNVEGKKDIATQTNQTRENVANIRGPTRGNSGTDDAKIDREAIMQMKSLAKPDAFGQVSAQNKQAIQALMGTIKTPGYKQMAQSAFGALAMPGGPQVAPVASQPQSAAPQAPSSAPPVPGAVQMRQKSTGKIVWVKDGKMVGQ